jgi:hypothetical protein
MMHNRRHTREQPAIRRIVQSKYVARKILLEQGRPDDYPTLAAEIQCFKQDGGKTVGVSGYSAAQANSDRCRPVLKKVKQFPWGLPMPSGIQKPVSGHVGIAGPVRGWRNDMRAKGVQERGSPVALKREGPPGKGGQMGMSSPNPAVQDAAALPKDLGSNPVGESPIAGPKGEVGKGRSGEITCRGEDWKKLGGKVGDTPGLGHFVAGVRDQERMNDGIGILTSHLDALQDAHRQGDHEPGHHPDHAEPISAGFIDEAADNLLRITGQPVKTNTKRCHEGPERFWCSQPDGVASLQKSPCKGHKGFHIATGAIGQKGNVHSHQSSTKLSKAADQRIARPSLRSAPVQGYFDA